MAEVARFFDTVSYSEADQAEVQNRFRSTGVLYEVAGQLLVSAPGGMFVRVATGEAMVEGFHYKNTANLSLAIAANASGSTRIDRVVLRLNRTANTLVAAIVQGTPGAGAPALTQVAGGTYEFPLAQVSVATGTLAITGAMITDQRVYSKALTSGAEVAVATAMPSSANVLRRVLTVDPATNELYFAEPLASRKNFLHNSSFRINQRNQTASLTVSGFMCDRWRFSAVGTNPGMNGTAVNIASGSLTLAGSESPNAITFNKSDASAVAADTIISFVQSLEGLDVQALLSQSMVLSFWAFSHVAGTFGVNLEQYATTQRYLGTFTINAVNTWEFKYIVVPWNAAGSWPITNAGSLSVRFVAACGATNKAAVSNAWDATNKFAAAALTNPLANGNSLYIAAPKLEIGTLPTKWEQPDYMLEYTLAMRQLFIESSPLLWIAEGANIAIIKHQLPMPMRTIPTFSLFAAPTAVVAAAPTATQVGLYSKGAYVTGFVYAGWGTFLGGNPHFATHIITSSGTSILNGDTGYALMGASVMPMFSAEL